jgi:hypothetical protein
MWSPAGPQSLEPLLRQSHDYRPEVTVLLQSLLTFACRGTKIKAQKEGEEQQQAAFPIFFLIQQSQATMGGVSSNTLKKTKTSTQAAAAGLWPSKTQATGHRTEKDRARLRPQSATKTTKPNRRIDAAETKHRLPFPPPFPPFLRHHFPLRSFHCSRTATSTVNRDASHFQRPRTPSATAPRSRSPPRFSRAGSGPCPARTTSRAPPPTSDSLRS